MDTSNDNDLQLLLAYADEHDPVLPSGLEVNAVDEPTDPEGSSEIGSFYNPGMAGNDLNAQGWGIFAPEGEAGDRLLAAIAPLVAAREAELGAPAPVFRVPAKMSPSDADSWRRDVYESADPDDQPFYQLFLGDLDQTPLALQQAQAIDSCVGRLAFSELEDYEAYAAKVLRWERAPDEGMADLLLHTVHDGTPATSIGARDLVAPLRELALDARERGKLSIGDLVESGDSDDPSPDQLIDTVTGRDRGLLFSLSHGEGAPRKGWSSVDQQRAGQGAMSFGRGGRLRGDDLRDRPFLPGGMWFMFACYGAGTPNESRFRHWLQQLRDAGKFRGKPEAVLRSLPTEGERPFVAALPRVALANPQGPLAFIGHLDLAWTYSFQELDRGKKDGTAGKFFKVLRSILRGDRIGLSLREITRAYLDKNQNLTDRYDSKRSQAVKGAPEIDDRIQMAHLWMARQELAGYTVLGDPAARLAQQARPTLTPQQTRSQAPIELRTPAPTPQEQAQEQAQAQSQVQATAQPPARAQAPAQQEQDTSVPRPELSAADLDLRVEAVQAMIIGDEGLRALTKRFAVDRSTLTRWLTAYTEAGREALRTLGDDDV